MHFCTEQEKTLLILETALPETNRKSSLQLRNCISHTNHHMQLLLLAQKDIRHFILNRIW